jgi:1-acyl-sn-glycerol-3-phosphate acyltransferase
MQFFNFIFLARSWASDRHHLASSLASLGKEARKEDRPFCFLLYPEGTLVSKDTRPVSKKFADKMGIVCLPPRSSFSNIISCSIKPDMKNTLLPRSTGLHYSLRSLVPRIPDLKLLDLTVVYPGWFLIRFSFF